MFTTNKKNDFGFEIRAYVGDAKTLLAFSLPEENTKDLAGFTILCSPKERKPYFLLNMLSLKPNEEHAQVATEPANSSVNAPIQKFRWLHVPGLFHQDDNVFFGTYVYTVTPRFFDSAGSLLPLSKKLSSEVIVEVAPFKKGDLELGFTRGFVQSQGFINHFGKKAIFKPKEEKLLFNTNVVAGKNNLGKEYTFKDLYKWSGFTAREKIFSILNTVQNNDELTLDVFAYDLNEPDVMKILLELAREGRIRMILDNATLHHDKEKPTPEDQFEQAFNKAQAGEAELKRGKFGRFQHNKVLIVKNKGKAVQVLTGSTNFSVTGIYVNSNHVALYSDRKVADHYADVFQEAWKDEVVRKPFTESDLATRSFDFKDSNTPKTTITFSPHTPEFAADLMEAINTRLQKEESSILFAVMDTGDKVSGPIAPTLTKLHERDDLFTAGITDSNNGITLFKPASTEGIRVSGKPSEVLLPEPFKSEKSVGLGHQVHHKFIVCGFNTPAAVVWFGSSNLAQKGEEVNGDQLIAVHDTDVATVFAIEALALVDHFHFRNKHSKLGDNAPASATPLTLFSTDKWKNRYYDQNDLHFLDRELFIGKVASLA
ncbi:MULTISPECIES: phospholipase D-like domain-containing protein [Niastella]|uniref:phospholipase D n=1 Tax=Niastella soli TaxID=2821487 RepID=A0ABS3Z6Q4_9BACT|nr:phospholipase D-like domain-containing protein [Niastella soli]MBO9205467.1 hypothetical protein [Niastella soli]